MLPIRDLARMDAALGAGPTGPVNYAWYQCLLHTAATAIWREAGRDVLPRLYTHFKAGGPSADLRATLSADVHPVFQPSSTSVQAGRRQGVPISVEAG